MPMRLRLVAALAVIGLALLAAYALLLRPQLAYASTVSAYAAKMVCSCVHVSGRLPASCLDDFTVDVSQLSIEATDTGARAGVLGGLVSEEARHFEGEGCRLVR